MGLYSIGALSKMVGISADTLRYYDEIGLFRPARVSDETGYRYYGVEQAADLARIIELKQYGFSLGEIKDILTQSGLSLTEIFLQRYFALENEKQKLQQAIDQLYVTIKNRREGFKMNKKVLVADDAPFMRMMVKDILTKDGYDVVGEAEDGRQAVQMYKALRPDVTVSNIVMPSMDGIEALKAVKDFDPDANVIVLSALSMLRPVVQALMAGARDFVAKPFAPDVLLQAVRASFAPAAGYNHEILATLLQYEHPAALNQQEVNKIIAAAHGSEDAFDIKAFLSQLKVPHDEASASVEASKHDLIMARLCRLEKTQEEILALLKNKAI